MASPPLERPALARLGQNYWTESRQPLASLVFIVPLLVTYEAALILLGPNAVRNGAEAWLRQLLDLVGFGAYFLLPTLTVCILLAWHHLTRRSWRFSPGVFYGMTGECVLLAICLWLMLQIQGIFLATSATGTGAKPPGLLGTAIGYLGAGIYEELLFRLVLLSVLAWVLRRFRLSPPLSLVGAMLLTSVLFSWAHYVGPNRDQFLFFTFLFRFLAGMFFSALFVYRGFGIAAGTHAAYDILVGLMQA
ncbi:MAG: CPBP family intramembrane glutamic endopeptidase [Thermoguttaceae bacterium]|jgi:membrane protease YdiL (CAAX protease family)